MTTRQPILLLPLLASLVACSSSDNAELPDPNPVLQDSLSASESLRQAIVNNAGYASVDDLILPDSTDYAAIPQDVNNPLSAEKVALGQLIFHDTAFAQRGVSGENSLSWSCASCHHAAAGFKSGNVQGIGEGGIGFGNAGESRVLSPEFDANAPSGSSNKPDIQPFSSPTILNTAYQDVMLWNGQFGNSQTSSINASVPSELLMTEGTPKEANSRELSGLETQAIAAMAVHRLKIDKDIWPLTKDDYIELWGNAYVDGSEDALADAGKAVAAFERTVLANKAPFQLWLRGDDDAMSVAEKRGAELFFGKAGCSACHRGPALSSEMGANADEVFFAIGFPDFNFDDVNVHGSISDTEATGRQSLSGLDSEKFTFKIPQLYNLADVNLYGHGNSFTSIREVLDYKNKAIPAKAETEPYLDSRFAPLNLTEAEMDELEVFLNDALRDPDLMRYQPDSVPSGECIIVDPLNEIAEYLCP